MARLVWPAAISAAAALGFAALVLTPALATGAQPGSPAAAAAATSYRLGSLVCHQQSVRSFRLGGVPLPVCARCTGLYAGAVAGAAAALGWLITGRLRRRRCRTTLIRVRAVLVASAVPTVLLWLVEHALGAAVPGWLRAGGALPLGASVAWLAGVASGGAVLTDTDGAPALD